MHTTWIQLRSIILTVFAHLKNLQEKMIHVYAMIEIKQVHSVNQLHTQHPINSCKAGFHFANEFYSIHTHHASIIVKHHTNTSLPTYFQKANSFQHAVIKLLANVCKITSRLWKILSSWNICEVNSEAN